MSALEKQGETPRTDKVLRNAARHPLAMGGQIFLSAPAPELLDLCRTLERELAQMAAQKAELEARLAEAQRDALPISPDLIEAQSFFQINITFHSSRERNEFYRWLIERSPAAERKESGNG